MEIQYEQVDLSVRPLPPRCRTFRLSEIKFDMTTELLYRFIDCFPAGNTGIQGNFRILSLASVYENK